MTTHVIRTHPARIWTAASVALTTLLSAPCFGQEQQDQQNVDDALDRALRAVADDPNLAPSTREAMSSLLQAIQSERASGGVAADAGQPAAPRTDAPDLDEPSFFDRLRTSGDLRLRHESSWLDMREDRHRQRLRFRYGAQLDINSELEIGARITTGDPEDARSPYQTWGDVFDKFDVSFDRLYGTWRPESCPGIFVTAGKFGHPFYSNPIYGELVWDADVQPEGVVAGYNFDDAFGLDQFKIVGGVYNVLEQSGGDDTRAYVIQATGSEDLGDDWLLSFGAGFYYYEDPTPDGATGILDDNRGNATLDLNMDMVPDAFASDFGVFNPIIAVQHRGDVPVTFSAEYMCNTRAEISDDSGYALGVAVGQARSKGDWQGYYQWQDIEQDAVFSPVVQDDFIHATGFEGHVLGIKYKFANNVEGHLWSLISEPDSGSTDEDVRLRFDLTISF